MKIDSADVMLMIDKTAEEIVDLYQDFILNHAKTLSKEQSYGQFFIFYSGATTFHSGKTMAIDSHGSLIDLEDLVKRIGSRKKQTAIAFFDCCKYFDKFDKSKVVTCKKSKDKHKKSEEDKVKKIKEMLR